MKPAAKKLADALRKHERNLLRRKIGPLYIPLPSKSLPPSKRKKRT